MEKIDFSAPSFVGFSDEEDILVDTGVLLAYLNDYDSWSVAHSFNVSLANDYGISFLTIDNKLVKNIEDNIDNFPNLGNVYYAPPEKQSYR